MGKYLKTRYPGIFQYVGKNTTVYGISYRTGGKKHREIIGSLLGEAQEKLAEKKALTKKGIVLSASEKRKITFEKLKEKYCELQKGERFFEVSKKHFVNAISDFSGIRGFSKSIHWILSNSRNREKKPRSVEKRSGQMFPSTGSLKFFATCSIRLLNGVCSMRTLLPGLEIPFSLRREMTGCDSLKKMRSGNSWMLLLPIL